MVLGRSKKSPVLGFLFQFRVVVLISVVRKQNTTRLTQTEDSSDEVDQLTRLLGEANVLSPTVLQTAMFCCSFD